MRRRRSTLGTCFGLLAARLKPKRRCVRPRALIRRSRKLGTIFPTYWTSKVAQKPQSIVCGARSRLPEGRRRARGHAMAMDAGLTATSRPHADSRLRVDARGCNGCVRQELATGIGPPAPGSPNTSKFAGQSARVANQMARLEGVASGWPGIEIMNPKFMWSRPPRITAPPEPGAKLVMGTRRKGRPPPGSQAMSGAERTRRYRRRLAELGKPSKASER